MISSVKRRDITITVISSINMSYVVYLFTYLLEQESFTAGHPFWPKNSASSATTSIRKVQPS